MSSLAGREQQAIVSTGVIQQQFSIARMVEQVTALYRSAATGSAST